MLKVLDKRTFYVLRWYAIRKFKLKPVEILLMCAIDGLSRRVSYCYASRNTLSTLIGVTDQTVYSTLRVLEKKSLIEFGPIHEKCGTRQVRPSAIWRSLIEALKLPEQEGENI